MKTVKILSFAAAALLTTSLYAKDEITIAPAPVADDTIQGSGSENRLVLGYMNYDSDLFQLSGYSAIFGSKSRDGNGYVSDGSIAISLLEGNDLSGVSLGGNYLFGAELGAPETVVYLGPTLNYTYMTSDVIDMTILTYGANAGVQHKVHVPFGTITPWFFASYTGGTADTKIYLMGTTTQTTTDIDFVAATQFGLDMYFKNIDTSLSSMYQTTESGNLLSISATFHF